MGMVLFVTCGDNTGPIFSKQKADATSYVGVVRVSRLVFGTYADCQPPGTLRACNGIALPFLHVQFQSRSGYYGLSRMKLFVWLVWSSRQMLRGYFETGHSCLLSNSRLHSVSYFHPSGTYTAYLLETTSLITHGSVNIVSVPGF
jgi:hypothetical protein